MHTLKKKNSVRGLVFSAFFILSSISAGVHAEIADTLNVPTKTEFSKESLWKYAPLIVVFITVIGISIALIMTRKK